MLKNDEILEIMKKAGVLLEGHFRLTSGRHSNRYLQCAKLFRNTIYSEELCKHLANMFLKCDIDVVVGPAYGAILMAYEVSRHLKCENFFTERDCGGTMTLRRGFTLDKTKKVLIVEDVVTTGGSVTEVIKIIEKTGAKICGIGAIVDRTGGDINFQYPFKSVISMKVESWDADHCPICIAESSVAIKPGSRNLV